MSIPAGRLLGSGEAEVWRAAAAGLPGSDASHDWRWGEVLEATYGWRPHRIVWNGPGWRAAIQFHVYPHRLRRVGISSPFLTTGGLLATPGAPVSELRDDLGRIAERLGLRHVDVREIGDGLSPAADEECTVRLKLRPRDQMLAGFPSKLRSQIRKPEKDGYSVAPVGTPGLAFYEHFRRKMHEFGTPVHSSRLFAEWQARMPELCRQFVVRNPAGAVVGGMFMTIAGGMANIPFAVVHEPGCRSAANMLLYWEALAHASDGGCTAVDFGRSRRGSGTHDFKLQWGGESLPLVNHRCGPGGTSVAGFGLRGVWAGRFTAMWSRLPGWMADACGPAVRRLIP